MSRYCQVQPCCNPQATWLRPAHGFGVPAQGVHMQPSSQDTGLARAAHAVGVPMQLPPPEQPSACAH